MKMRLAGLRFVIGGHLHIHSPPGVGSRCHSFFLCLLAYLKRNKDPGLCLRLDHGVIWMHIFNGKLIIRRFVGKQYEIKHPAWSG
jgi:hypothetical protein